jgi:hypothetical protein
VDGPSTAVSLCQNRNAQRRTWECVGCSLLPLVLKLAISPVCVWERTCVVFYGLPSVNYSCQYPISQIVWVLQTLTYGTLRVWW